MPLALPSLPLPSACTVLVGSALPPWATMPPLAELLGNALWITDQVPPAPESDLYAKLDRILGKPAAGSMPPVRTVSWYANSAMPQPRGAALLDLRPLGCRPLDHCTLPVWRVRCGERDRDARATWYSGEPTLAVLLEVTTPTGQRLGAELARIAVDRVSWLRTQQAIDQVIGRWWTRILASALAVPLEPWPALAVADVPTVRALLRTVATVVARKLRHRTVGEAWRVGVRRKQPALWPLKLRDWHWLPTPRGAFDADPFLAHCGEQAWLFFERMPKGSHLGEIWCAPLDADGRPGRAELALRAPHHLAFPQVFYEDGHWWMVPDTAGTDGIQVYRAHAFPHDWRLDQVWLAGASWVDPVVHRQGELWWLLATPLMPGHVHNDELHAFCAAQLGGPWVPHPQNPVETDVRWARNAGRLQVHGDQLWRVAQDCGSAYGAGITVRRLDCLAADRWRESTVQHLPAQTWRGWDGVHTWNQDGQFEAIDIRWWRPGKGH